MLIDNGTINSSAEKNKKILRLFRRDHRLEIRNILNFEKLVIRALKMQSSTEKTKNLHSRFYEHADQNRSKGVYYFYTEKEDPDSRVSYVDNMLT